MEHLNSTTWAAAQTAKKVALESVAKQIPGAYVRVPQSGNPLIVITTPHPNGMHSVTWSNYPATDPAIYRIFSHYDDFRPEVKTIQKVWTVISTPQLLSTLAAIYGPDPTVVPVNVLMALKQKTGTAWVEALSRITHADLPDAEPLDIAADIMTDLLDYMKTHDLSLPEVHAAALDYDSDTLIPEGIPDAFRSTQSPV